MSKEEVKRPLVISILTPGMRVLLFIFMVLSLTLICVGATNENGLGIILLGLVSFMFWSLPLYLRAGDEAIARYEAQKDRPAKSLESVGTEIIDGVQSIGFLVLLLVVGCLIIFGLSQLIGFLSGLSVGTLLVIIILILLFK